MFFSSVSLNICATSSSFNSLKNNWFLRLECIVRTLYVVTIYAVGVFLILLGVALVWLWLACWQLWCEVIKICMYNKWDSYWDIVILKYIFDPSSGSSILIASYDLQCACWDDNDFSELKVLRHLKHTCLICPCFDVCKDNSLLISLIQQ